jgi:hypothetical protein
MAAPTMAFQTYQAAGNREDLEDVIYSISPTETPFVTMASRVEASAVLHEWQTDALSDAATNAQIEGDDASGGTSVATSRLGMYCQIASKYAVVSDTQQAVDKAGRSSEMSYQVAKRLGELKRDIEFAVTRNQGSSAGSATTPRSTAGVESWLTNAAGASMVGNSTSIGTGSAAGGYTTPGWTSGGSILAPTDSTTAGTFTVAPLKAVIRACWTAGGNPGIIMCGPVTKQTISGFAGIATIYREAGTTAKGTAIVGAADLYISDFGEHRVVPNRFSRDRTCLVLDMDYWKIGYLRKVSQKEIARTGASIKRYIDCEFALVASNPKASGKVSDILV